MPDINTINLEAVRNGLLIAGRFVKCLDCASSAVSSGGQQISPDKGHLCLFIVLFSVSFKLMEN